MNKRLIAAIMAAGLICSFTACDFLNGKKPEITTTAVETTTEETTTTVEETTTIEETTTADETTTSEETTTTSEETTSETSATQAPTKKPTKAPAKPSSVPKGWEKVPEVWGDKQYGRKVYVIWRNRQGYKGWYNGKWIQLYVTEKFIKASNEDGDEDYDRIFTFYRDKNHKKKYATYTD